MTGIQGIKYHLIDIGKRQLDTRVCQQFTDKATTDITCAKQMALEAARQVIGQTPTVDNSALIKQIQQLLQQEPLFSGKPQLRVHPDDLQRVDDMLGATLSLHGWRLRGDPTLHPGGCKVSADEGDLDASVATRWQELCRLAAPGVV